MSTLKEWRKVLELQGSDRKYYHSEMKGILEAGEEEVKKIEEEMRFLLSDHTNTLKTLDSAVRFNGSKNRIIEKLEENVVVLERMNRNRVLALKKYSEHHSSCKECYKVWQEINV